MCVCVRACVRACVCVWFHESSIIIVVDVVSFARDYNSNFVCLQRTTKYFFILEGRWGVGEGTSTTIFFLFFFIAPV